MSCAVGVSVIGTITEVLRVSKYTVLTVNAMCTGNAEKGHYPKPVDMEWGDDGHGAGICRYCNNLIFLQVGHVIAEKGEEE